MSKFKVGDKVKLLRQYGVIKTFFDYPEEVKTIIDVGESRVMVYCDKESIYQEVHPDDLVKVEQDTVVDSLQKHIDNVMDWFDFGKVHRAMVALDWKWVNTQDGIPNQAEMRQMVRKLMKDCYSYKDKETYSNVITTGTGGFEVSYDKEEDYFTVKFCVDSWESCVEDGVTF